MGTAQTCDLTPHEFALIQRGMIQFALGKRAIRKYAIGKVAVLKSLLGERQVSKPFTFTITLCHKILLSAQFFQQSRPLMRCTPSPTTLSKCWTMKP